MSAITDAVLADSPASHTAGTRSAPIGPERREALRATFRAEPGPGARPGGAGHRDAEHLLDRLLTDHPDPNAADAIRPMSHLDVYVSGAHGRMRVTVLPYRGEVRLEDDGGPMLSNDGIDDETAQGARWRRFADGGGALVFGPDADDPKAAPADPGETTDLVRRVLAKARHLAEHGIDRPLASFGLAKEPRYDFLTSQPDHELRWRRKEAETQASGPRP